jgi:hypothetical protein
VGIVENWLRNIRDVARFHLEELLAIKDNEQRHRRLVDGAQRAGAVPQHSKIGTVQRKRLKTFVNESYALPRVHGFVLDPKDGGRAQEAARLQVPRQARPLLIRLVSPAQLAKDRWRHGVGLVVSPRARRLAVSRASSRASPTARLHRLPRSFFFFFRPN